MQSGGYRVVSDGEMDVDKAVEEGTPRMEGGGG